MWLRRLRKRHYFWRSWIVSLNLKHIEASVLPNSIDLRWVRIAQVPRSQYMGLYSWQLQRRHYQLLYPLAHAHRVIVLKPHHLWIYMYIVYSPVSSSCEIFILFEGCQELHRENCYSLLLSELCSYVFIRIVVQCLVQCSTCIQLAWFYVKHTCIVF